MQEPTISDNSLVQGLNLDAKTGMVQKGQLTYALNAVVSGIEGNSLGYQNEPGNTKCTNIPTGFVVVGVHAIPENQTTILWLYDESTSRRMIGILDNNLCYIRNLITATCFQFSLGSPVMKAVHRKTNCGTEVYWVSKGARPSFIDIDNLPYQTSKGTCDNIPTLDIDCNKTAIQPNFSIPQLEVTAIKSDGNLKAGTYQFAIGYENPLGEPLTSLYSVTNPVPIFDPNVVTEQYDYTVAKSIEVKVTGLDTTGVFDNFGLVVIQTVNGISTVYKVGTYPITSKEFTTTYTGDNQTEIQGDILDVFVKYPVYESAEDITNAQDTLILGKVTQRKRISYQSIANNIKLQWHTITLPVDAYSDPLNVNKYTGYLRGEVYAFEVVFLLEDGTETDGFHIPGREATAADLEFVSNADTNSIPVERWRVYSTGTIIEEVAEGELYGEFSYWESSANYPCDEIWGDLKNKPIRHHKFPDSTLVPFFEHDSGSIFVNSSSSIHPIGFKIDVESVRNLISNSSLTSDEKAAIKGFKIVRADRKNNKSIIAKGVLRNMLTYTADGTEQYAPNYLFNDTTTPDPYYTTVENENSGTRFVFNSPNTSFFQPNLGTKLEIEGTLHGTAKMHFKKVKDHAAYVLNDDHPNTKTNLAYSLNSVGTLNNFDENDKEGSMIRDISIKTYLSPGYQGVGDDLDINNFERESSIYIKTSSDFGNAHSGPADNTKELPECTLGPNADAEAILKDYTKTASLEYASILNEVPDQYGLIYSYDVVDTGFEYVFGEETPQYGFGGDTFINMFAFKSKLPLFVENMVGKADNSDVFYSLLGNLGKTRYYTDFAGFKSNGDYDYIDIKTFCRLVIPIAGYSAVGILPLFLYGIIYFPVESEVNVDLRQATNPTNGDFYPHVTTAIPDEWLQEINTPIIQDNTYNYNITYSKQNRELSVSHIPNGYDFDACNYTFPFRAVFSEPQQNVSNPLARNNWRIFKADSYFDFPHNYGELISLDGIENKQVYARFQNKTLLYNALLTAPTTAESVYLGQSLFKSDVPPIDFADTDLGFAGTQNKFFLRTEYGHVSVDAMRGNVLLYQGQQVKDLGKQGISKFLEKHLPFELPTYIDVETDNNFAGIGITGVYDPKFNRLILTKLDYKPKIQGITYTDAKFYHNGVEVSLTDTKYFTNRSFTLSYDFTYNFWVSFHSYFPNYYIGEIKHFKTGNSTGIWNHSKDNQKFNNFYNEIVPYVIEFPTNYQTQDELLQSILDYSKVDTILDDEGNYVQVDDGYFTKLILSNDQQTSGILKLVPRPIRNMYELNRYPLYNEDSKTVIYTKTDNVYRVNTFWSVTLNPKKALWIPSPNSVSEWKILNQANCNYKKKSHSKAPLRAKDLKTRYILDDRDDIRITSQFTLQESEKSII